MQIRKYREEDLPAIMALGNEAWRPIRRRILLVTTRRKKK